MTKAEITTKLTDEGVDLTPSKDGTLKSATLELILDGLALPGVRDQLATKTSEAKDAEEKLSTSEKARKDLEKERDDFKEDVDTLNAKLAELERNPKGKNKKPIHKLGKRVFEQVIPKSRIMMNGKVHPVTEETLRNTEGLLAHCVKINAGCIKEVTNS